MYKNRAFSLIEILIVVAILAIIGAIGSGFYINYGRNISLKSTAQTIVFDLKNAQSKSMTGVGGFKWGIHFVNGDSDYYETFSTPTDYNNLSKVVVSTKYLPDSIFFADPISGSSKDVIFNKISGSTTSSLIKIISSDFTKNINISSIGGISEGSVMCDGTGAPFSCGNSCEYNNEIYPTVLIGEQCWFAENLRTTKYPNGDDITKGPSAQGSAGWFNYSTQYYSCPPDVTNTSEDCVASGDSNKLGLLYQWKTTMNGSSTVSTGTGPQGICPAGWHIPTDDNTVSSGWGKLFSYVDSIPGCTGKTGTCLKVGGSTGLNIPFSGARNAAGNYSNRGTWFNIWSSSEGTLNTKSWNRRLYYTNTALYRIEDFNPIAFSVRCLKD